MRIESPCSMGGQTVARRERLWQLYMLWEGHWCGVMFGLAGPLMAWTTYGVTGHHHMILLSKLDLAVNLA